MNTLDILIIEYLKKGYNQAEIAIKLQEQEIKPNSLSSVEKKLKTIREFYGAKTLFHLGYIIALEKEN